MPNDFLEKTLEEIIFYNRHRIIKRGFNEEFYDHTERQFLLPSGRRIDILTWQIRGNVIYANIIELKKDQATNAAFWQGLDYLDEFTTHLFGTFGDMKMKLTIIGKDIYDSVSKLLCLDSKILKLYDYIYDWDGIRFSEHNYTSNKIISGIKRDIIQPFIKPESAIYYPAIEFSNRLRLFDAEKIEEGIKKHNDQQQRNIL